MYQHHKGRIKGFTLLEVLLVIAVIGILAAITLVAINPNRQISQVRNTQRRSDVNIIYKALEQYNIDVGSYPTGITTTLKDICSTGIEKVGGVTNCTNKVDLRVLVPDYIASIPVDPAGGIYRVSINEENSRIRVLASNSELGQIIVVNPAVEERLQAQITAGTLVPTATQQLVEGRLVYTNNANTQTYIDKPTTNIICPTGYIPIPGNSMYNTTDFCVMKYEAKAVAISNPTVGLKTPITGFNTISNNTTATTTANGRAIASVASGYPIANISQTTAASYCVTAGANLITNAEWMTIARNIEGVNSNWTGGSVGNGGLWRGHSDWNPNTTLEASTDNDPYNGTGNISPTIQKRTHALSNGELIWDLSGNSLELTNDTIMGSNKLTSSSTLTGVSEFTNITGYGSLNYDLVRPSNNTWNSSQNMGQFFISSTSGGPFVLVRGGAVDTGFDTGIFNLYMNLVTSGWSPIVGFRCVFR